MVKDKFKTAAVTVSDGGKNVIISETHTVEGVDETIAAQLNVDYRSRTVSLLPIGTNWVNMNNFMIDADTVERFKKQLAVMNEAAVAIEDALGKVGTTVQIEG